MFQSTILGRIPYVNVDIAHKAFPSRTELIELIKTVGYDHRSRRDVNLSAPLDYNVITNLSNHLRGLDIGYNMPGGTGTKAYKFARLTEPAATLKFPIEGKETTVENYFAQRGHRLKYPKLPCVSTVGKSFFPVELCYVIGGQVKSDAAKVALFINNKKNYLFFFLSHFRPFKRRRPKIRRAP